ncbi:MAG: ATP-dependent DNA helicase RecG [Saprospiraceae bacterium]|nr:ATP-dependent DNA helicase RecG [Saprospiraceae bacterium]
MALRLDSPLEFVKGVGPQRARLLSDQLGMETVGAMLLYFPFRYIDKTRYTPLAEATQDGQFYQCRGKLTGLEQHGYGRSRRLTAMLEDGTGRIELIWFQHYQWFLDKAEIGREYRIFGRLKQTRSVKTMAHPEIAQMAAEPQPNALRWEPVYSSSEVLAKKGYDSRGIKNLVFQIFQNLDVRTVEETLPPYILEKYRLMNRQEALLNIHFPKDEQSLARARQRFKFEELFILQLRMVRNMYLRKKKDSGIAMSSPGELYQNFYRHHLPFALTGAQERVLKEIQDDLCSGYQMNRLLQGDVGSGKTIVALLTMVWAISQGFQACIMAPTEVLAQQHYESIASLIRSVDLRCALLTSSVKANDRMLVLGMLARGEIHILIGTHAVLEDKVVFSQLGLVVIDEQHRFGVEQRARLWGKAHPLPPHVLVMTATPIPRTLAMSLYGDLDVSVIDELPPNRQAIVTKHFTEAYRTTLYEFMKEQIAGGRQVYIVFPLIEESAKMDIENLEMGYERLLEYFPRPQYQIAVVHGRLKPKDKAYEMARFARGRANIMVATTVIEVGVNVPNATIMVIENAERFGLSQLHQLRGRVGRGADQSYCVLMTANRPAGDAAERIRTLCATNDGFAIAEADLRLRGPGDLDGTRQSGLLELKVANLSEDQPMLYAARRLAEAILKRDPSLDHPLNALLRKLFEGDPGQPIGKIA